MNDFGIDTSSRHKMGDTIILDFFHCGKLSTGIISGIKYTDYGKVFYDITLHPFSNEKGNEDLKITLKDIDGYFVKTEYDEIINPTNP